MKSLLLKNPLVQTKYNTSWFVAFEGKQYITSKAKPTERPLGRPDGGSKTEGFLMREADSF